MENGQPKSAKNLVDRPSGDAGDIDTSNVNYADIGVSNYPKTRKSYVTRYNGSKSGGKTAENADKGKNNSDKNKKVADTAKKDPRMGKQAGKIQAVLCKKKNAKSFHGTSEASDCGNTSSVDASENTDPAAEANETNDDHGENDADQIKKPKSADQIEKRGKLGGVNERCEEVSKLDESFAANEAQGCGNDNDKAAPPSSMKLRAPIKNLRPRAPRVDKVASSLENNNSPSKNCRRKSKLPICEPTVAQNVTTLKKMGINKGAKLSEGTGLPLSKNETNNSNDSTTARRSSQSSSTNESENLNDSTSSAVSSRTSSKNETADKNDAKTISNLDGVSGEDDFSSYSGDKDKGSNNFNASFGKKDFSRNSVPQNIQSRETKVEILSSTSQSMINVESTIKRKHSHKIRENVAPKRKLSARLAKLASEKYNFSILDLEAFHDAEKFKESAKDVSFLRESLLGGDFENVSFNFDFDSYVILDKNKYDPSKDRNIISSPVEYFDSRLLESPKKVIRANKKPYSYETPIMKLFDPESDINKSDIERIRFRLVKESSDKSSDLYPDIISPIISSDDLSSRKLDNNKSQNSDIKKRNVANKKNVQICDASENVKTAKEDKIDGKTQAKNIEGNLSRELNKLKSGDIDKSSESLIAKKNTHSGSKLDVQKMSENLKRKFTENKNDHYLNHKLKEKAVNSDMKGQTDQSFNARKFGEDMYKKMNNSMVVSPPQKNKNVAKPNETIISENNAESKKSENDQPRPLDGISRDNNKESAETHKSSKKYENLSRRDDDTRDNNRNKVRDKSRRYDSRSDKSPDTTRRRSRERHRDKSNTRGKSRDRSADKYRRRSNEKSSRRQSPGHRRRRSRDKSYRRSRHRSTDKSYRRNRDSYYEKSDYRRRSRDKRGRSSEKYGDSKDERDQKRSQATKSYHKNEEGVDKYDKRARPADKIDKVEHSSSIAAHTSDCGSNIKPVCVSSDVNSKNKIEKNVVENMDSSEKLVDPKENEIVKNTTKVEETEDEKSGSASQSDKNPQQDLFAQKLNTSQANDNIKISEIGGHHENVLRTKASFKEVLPTRTKASLKEIPPLQTHNGENVRTKASVKEISSPKASAKDLFPTKAALKEIPASKATTKETFAPKDSSKEPLNSKASVKEPFNSKVSSVKEPLNSKASAKELSNSKVSAKEPSNSKASAKEPSNSKASAKEPSNSKASSAKDIPKQKGDIKIKNNPDVKKNVCSLDEVDIFGNLNSVEQRPRKKSAKDKERIIIVQPSWMATMQELKVKDDKPAAFVISESKKPAETPAPAKAPKNPDDAAKAKINTSSHNRESFLPVKLPIDDYSSKTKVWLENLPDFSANLSTPVTPISPKLESYGETLISKYDVNYSRKENLPTEFQEENKPIITDNYPEFTLNRAISTSTVFPDFKIDRASETSENSSYPEFKCDQKSVCDKSYQEFMCDRQSENTVNNETQAQYSSFSDSVYPDFKLDQKDRASKWDTDSYLRYYSAAKVTEQDNKLVGGSTDPCKGVPGFQQDIPPMAKENSNSSLIIPPMAKENSNLSLIIPPMAKENSKSSLIIPPMAKENSKSSLMKTIITTGEPPNDAIERYDPAIPSSDISPSQGNFPSFSQDAAPSLTKDSVPLKDNFVPSLKDSISSIKDSIPSIKDSSPSLKDSIPSVKDSMPLIKDNVPLENNSVPSRKNSFSSQKDSVPPKKDSVSRLPIKDIPQQFKHRKNSQESEIKECSSGTTSADENVTPNAASGTDDTSSSVVSYKQRRSSRIRKSIASFADFMDFTPPPPQKAREPSPEPLPIPEAAAKSFTQIKQNEYLTERSISKEAKRMLCDCIPLTKDEYLRGEAGCADDCLNRLLFIECGSRCTLGDRCSNKQFQNLAYRKCEVFHADQKGHGLRAVKDISPGSFIMEYVGEVVDWNQFQQRCVDRNKKSGGTAHFYYMALNSEHIIDATDKGNISRFINHSCDPNAETQKWTVQGEVRIGFFSKRFINAGEELTFNYRFQRYGKNAQRCFCGTALCRGWIGQSPEELEGEGESEVDVEMEEEPKLLEKESAGKEEEVGIVAKDGEKDLVAPARTKIKKTKIKKLVDEFDDWEQTLEEISQTGLMNRHQTLRLNRLMVHTKRLATRLQILRLLQEADSACRRLFIDYHGLPILWSWMVDAENDDIFMTEVLKTLGSLPITNKTILMDTKVWTQVEKCSQCVVQRSTSKSKIETHDRDRDVESSRKNNAAAAQDDNTSENEDHQSTSSEGDVPGPPPLPTEVALLAKELLKSWTTLHEAYKIPKKERILLMKEHEFEADLVSHSQKATDKASKYSRKRKNAESIDNVVWLRKKIKRNRMEEMLPKLTKEEKLVRRQQFEEQVARDEDARKRLAELRENGLWPPAPPPPPPPPPAEQENSQDMQPQMDYAHYFAHEPQMDMFHSQQMLMERNMLPGLMYPAMSENLLPGAATYVNPAGYVESWPSYDSSFMMTTTPQMYMMPDAPAEIYPPLPAENPLINVEQPQPPPDEDVNPVLIQVPIQDVEDDNYKLPPQWKSAFDKNSGRTYYYHSKKKVPQWEKPTWNSEDYLPPLPSTPPPPPEPPPESPKSTVDGGEIDYEECEFESDDEESAKQVDTTTSEAAAAIWQDPRIKSILSELSMDFNFDDSNDEDEDDMPSSTTAPDSTGDPIPEEPDGEGPTTTTEKRVPLITEHIISPRKKATKLEKMETKLRILETKKKIALSKLKEKRLVCVGLGKSTQKIDEEERILRKKFDLKKAAITNKKEASKKKGEERMDQFHADVTKLVKNHLNAYFKKDCRKGRIETMDDYKYLARKLAHAITNKESKSRGKAELLKMTKSIKEKANKYIAKYMSRFGEIYRRDASPSQTKV